MQADPFDDFEGHPLGLAVYHLGNKGTARGSLDIGPSATPRFISGGRLSRQR